MFSSGKILKPDVPPKHRSPKLRFLRNWITHLFFPARHLLPIGNAIAEQSSPSKRKIFGRNRP
jgi:hypothetical protein